MGALVKLENISKLYSLGKTTIHALKNIHFSVEKGDFICIAGPSGSGKTTLLNMIGCLDKPTSGRIYIKGKDISTVNDKELTEIRSQVIGFIFQSFNLLPVLNVYENVEIPLLLKKNFLSKQEREKIILPILERIGLKEYIKHKPEELSGGQRQRTAIARSLVGGPDLVLADEPTANLDSKTGQEIISLMSDLNNDSKTTFVISSHDPMIINFAQKVVRIKDGEIM